MLVHNASAGCSPCDTLKVGINADGSLKDERNYTRKAKMVLNERSAKDSSTSGQVISVDAVTSVVARLRSSAGGSGTGTPEQRWTQCVVGVRTDQAGHVLASSWGGSGKLKDMNLFPVFANANTGRQSAFEKKVKDAIGKKDVCVVVLFDYDDSDTVYPARPVAVHYAAYIDGIGVLLCFPRSQ